MHYYVHHFILIIVQYAYYSIDTFLFLGGFLGALSIYRNIHRMGGKPYLFIPLAIIMRVLRMWPMMLYVTAIQWQWSDQLPYGWNVWSRDIYTYGCGNNWWGIMFFVQEFTNAAGRCMEVLWYIQMDMLLYLFLPFNVWLFSYKKLWGLYSALTFIVISLICSIFNAFYYNAPANNSFSASYEKNHDPPEGISIYSVLALMSFISCYASGVALAFFMVILDEKKKNFALQKWQYFTMMMLSGFILLCLMMWPYDDVKESPENRWGLYQNSAYNAFAKTAWGVALSMMTFALRYLDEKGGQRSMIKQFLSVTLWQPLQKLTFVMYMLHPVIGLWYIKDMDIPMYYSIWNAVAYLAVMLCVTMGFTMLLYVFMEQPISLLISAGMKRLLGGAMRKQKTVSLQRQSSRILTEIEHHPSHGIGIDDVEPSLSGSESDSRSGLDDYDDDTETLLEPMGE